MRQETIIGSDNGLSPGRHQAIVWTNVGIYLIQGNTSAHGQWIIYMYLYIYIDREMKMSLKQHGHFATNGFVFPFFRQMLINHSYCQTRSALLAAAILKIYTYIYSRVVRPLPWIELSRLYLFDIFILKSCALNLFLLNTTYAILTSIHLSAISFTSRIWESLQQGSFCVCAQPMRDGVTF